ncbi:uncharacterized protein LTHEOB_2862 [Lasiodiplodia theobromae]|uniref:uncharacterized protein n=1 Tax=Lasiodiplodia theobromae TaxID=45133 RepID=UPI0015C356EF|nr:uncharacterized protein LTHEOB_2862 [Lasiodiplodia theobromae]KAF4534887.1 hypothetical protein LTHEOB_2862 [Lasiodiplodia theobromae]
MKTFALTEFFRSTFKPDSSIFSASDDSSDFTFSFSEDELTVSQLPWSVPSSSTSSSTTVSEVSSSGVKPSEILTTVERSSTSSIIFFNVVLYNFEVVIYDILQGFVQRAIILKFYVIINLDFHDIVYKVFNLLDCYVIVDCCPDSTCGESFGSAE